jgi:hypothetical protein
MTTENRDMMNNAEPDNNPRLSELYRAGSQEQPPSHLDDAILALARRESKTKPRPAKTHSSRWAIPVSIAAVLVLSVSVVTLVKQELPETLTESPQLSQTRESKPGVNTESKHGKNNVKRIS